MTPCPVVPKLFQALDEYERQFIVQTLRECRQRTKAARRMGLTRKMLWMRMKKFCIRESEWT